MFAHIYVCGGQVQGISTFLFVAFISLFCLLFYLVVMCVCMCMCVHSYVYCGGETVLNCSFNRKRFFFLTKVNLILCSADRILYLGHQMFLSCFLRQVLVVSVCSLLSIVLTLRR